MVQLKQLLEMHTHGVLNIKYEDGNPIARIGDTQLNMQQAAIMCQNLGWDTFVLSPFVIIDKTKKFIAGLKRSMDNQYIWERALISFDNKASTSEYGKTFDRIHIACDRQFEISILYKMPGNSATYVVYNSFTSAPVQRCKTMKQVGEYLSTLV